MMAVRFVSVVLLVLGVLVSGVLATDTEMLFFWPGCALLGAAALVAGISWRMRVYSVPDDVCLLSVLLLVGYVLLRGYLSPVAVHARVDMLMALAGLVTYLLTATLLSHPRFRLVLVATVVLLLLGNLVVGTIHFSGYWSFHVVPHFARSFGEGRVGGFFNNANHLAAYLLFAVLLLGGYLVFGRAAVSAKLLIGFLGLGGVIGLVLTLSRAGLVGLVAGGLVLAILSLWVVWRTNRHLVMLLVMGGGDFGDSGWRVVVSSGRREFAPALERIAC